MTTAADTRDYNLHETLTCVELETDLNISIFLTLLFVLKNDREWNTRKAA